MRLQGSEHTGSTRPEGQEPGDEQPIRLFCPDWEVFPTQSPLCNGNDGFPAGLDTATISTSKWRVESIKAGGNAIVPEVALELFKAIDAYEKMNRQDQPD